MFVLSAGPDEEIDTRSAQDGAVPGDDDFIYVVSSMRSRRAMRGERGLSLIEATVILATLAILTAMLAPSVQ